MKNTRTDRTGTAAENKQDQFWPVQACFKDLS